MHKRATAIAAAIGSLAFASAAQAATFIVTAKGHEEHPASEFGRPRQAGADDTHGSGRVNAAQAVRY